MRAITIRQPFASLVVTGRKRLETRKWFTSYRGPLLIHAARSVHREPIRGVASLEGLPLGAIVGRVHVIGCLSENELTRSSPLVASFTKISHPTNSGSASTAQATLPGSGLTRSSSRRRFRVWAMSTFGPRHRASKGRVKGDAALRPLFCAHNPFSPPFLQVQLVFVFQKQVYFPWHPRSCNPPYREIDPK